jgi:hypothetical protein
MGEKWQVKFSLTNTTSTSLWGSFTCRKSATWDRRLYFPSEGRHAEDFFRPKNPTASAGFEATNLGTTHDLHISISLSFLTLNVPN